MPRKQIIPRGIRNNNPLNIRIGNTWLGERENPTEPAFEEFVTMEYGLRAAFLILRRYIRRYKKNTMSAIISTWAPETENQTKAYIQTVSSATNIPADATILFEDRETMVKIVCAMAKVECGQSIPQEKVYKGYDMA